MTSRNIAILIGLLVIAVAAIAAVTYFTPSPKVIGNDTASSTSAAYVAPSCATAGCSGTICTEVGKAPGLVTTCEYRDEYACYKNARCEVQSDGKCGWTQSAALTACIQATGNFDLKG